jgi:glycosyltransferase involved in cell wall biosynthesis
LHQTVTERDNQVQSLAQTVTERDGRIEILTSDIQGLHQTVTERDNQVQSLAQTVTERDGRIFWLEHALKDSKNEIVTILESNSWKITKPFRFFRREFIDNPKNKFISIFKGLPRKIWRALPLSINSKNRIKLFLSHAKYSRDSKFSHIPFLNKAVSIDNKIIGHSNEFVLKTSLPILANKSVRVICFYLPQYHEIPENNSWWGDGFTEWTNVKPATPNFDGHYQPHLPADLGYYDLLDNETQAKQVELAKLYGVEGFCFYFYWFGGKTLLEAPLLNYLHNPDLDLPFCLCWANENWSRRWDGLDSEILIEQSHSEGDDLDFISHIADYLKDDRYIRIDGKPLVVVYRPSLLPSAIETANRWRNWCRDHDVGEIYLAYTQSFENVDPKEYGFDAAIEFPPNNSSPPDITEEIQDKSDDFVGTIYDWRIFLERSYNYVDPEYTLFRSVCPSWDNTARRKERGTIFAKSEPFYYQKWLENAVNHTVAYRENEQERLVFVNAWNEWAEGAHLEPDLKYGYAYLQATRDALATTNTIEDASKLLLITHDCHPHGAQFLALEVARELIRNGYQISILALKGGKLREEFSQLGSMLIAEEFSKEDLSNFLKQCRRTGCNKVIASTTVSGEMLPELKAHGFKVLSLVHELPGVIRAMNLEESAKKIAELADVAVFPAQVVLDQFETIAKLKINKSIIRPQGLLRKNPYQAHNEAAYNEVCNRHDLPRGARIILNVGYLDYRKGPDLFVEIAALLCKNHKDIYFIWVGHVDPEMESLVRKRIFELGLEKYILLAGFNKEPFDYYAAATIFALTSREDPFPNVVLESVSVGVPVIAFEGATGAADFIVEHGGALAFSLDSEDFARKISGLLEGSINRAEVSLGNDFSLHKYVLDLMHYLDGTLRVSVIVPNYNYARLIQRRLDSICSQTYPIYEIIVLDDASNDDSSAVIKNYQKKSIYPIKFYENEVNSGSVFRQWTKGVEYASGDLIWLAEADDLSEPPFLSTLVPAFCDKNLVIAYCQSRQVDEAGNIQANDYFEYTSGLDNCWSQEYLRGGVEEIRKALTIKNSIPNVSAVLFERQALINAFNAIDDELFKFRVAGDWLVYLNVLTQGRIYFNPNSLNNHCRHSNSVTNTLSAINHLTEVKRVQETALLMIEADQGTRDAARAYLKILCQHFGVNDSIIHESL